MIRYDFPQGSEEWKRARLGVVTGSGFDKILTNKTLKPSAQSEDYLAQLVAETILGAPLDDVSSQYMDRGTELEPEARNWYAFHRDADVDQVGFITTDDGRVGCSPDGLVGADLGLELKCPSAKTHVMYARKPEALVMAYRGQIQAGMYVTGRKAWDIVSYNPIMEPVIVRCEPDKAYLAALEPVLAAFLADLDATLTKQRAYADHRRASNPFL